jgi:hypothetical protein
MDVYSDFTIAAFSRHVTIPNEIPHHQVQPPTTYTSEAVLHQNRYNCTASRMPLYLNPHSLFTLNEVTDLFNATEGIVAAGSFNAKHCTWRSRVDHHRGDQLRQFCATNKLNFIHLNL